jgi:hypothetical protein
MRVVICPRPKKGNEPSLKKVVRVPDSWDDFLLLAGTKLNLIVGQVTLENGAIVEDLDCLQAEDVLYIAGVDAPGAVAGEEDVKIEPKRKGRKKDDRELKSALLHMTHQLSSLVTQMQDNNRNVEGALTRLTAAVEANQATVQGSVLPYRQKSLKKVDLLLDRLFSKAH